MDAFEIINNDRLSHGYSTLHFKTYNKHCNRMKRTTIPLKLVYSLESNLAKFRMLQSLAYLYKNKRLLKNPEGKFQEAYLKYTEILISNCKGSLKIDQLVELRHQLAEYYTFLDDIDQICDNRHDFDQYKVKHQWNDITIVFETQKILETFLTNSFFLNDFRFNTQLARKILAVENKKRDLESALAKTLDPFQMFQHSGALLASVNDLKRFIDDNFVESEFVRELTVDCEQVHVFMKKLMEYCNGIIHTDLDSFVAPRSFEAVSEHFEAMKKTRKINPKKLRNMLLDIVEKRLSVDCKSRKMPFLPVFYDLANDYVEYKTVDNSVAGILQSFSFFNRKN